jgi:hypothetical protein
MNNNPFPTIKETVGNRKLNENYTKFITTINEYTNIVAIAGIYTGISMGTKKYTNDFLDGEAKMYAGVSGTLVKPVNNNNDNSIQIEPIKWMFKKDDKKLKDPFNIQPSTPVVSKSKSDAISMFNEIITLSKTTDYSTTTSFLGKIGKRITIGKHFQLVFVYNTVENEQTSGTGIIHYGQDSFVLNKFDIVNNKIIIGDSANVHLSVKTLLQDLIGNTNLTFNNAVVDKEINEEDAVVDKEYDNLGEAERIEAERVEAERVEAERIEAERIEAERVEAVKNEADNTNNLISGTSLFGGGKRSRTKISHNKNKSKKNNGGGKKSLKRVRSVKKSKKC